uniref:Uncharacterized protein n=1 Tax=Anguilla anguilla TaxID=7936 RepID=A0A0E9SZA0_ANGAN
MGRLMYMRAIKTTVPVQTTARSLKACHYIQKSKPHTIMELLLSLGRDDLDMGWV